MTTPDLSDPQARLSRRTVFKWFAATAAALSAGELASCAPTTSLPATPPPPLMPPIAIGAVKGYGTDPKLNRFYEPGDVWPLRLSAAQRDLVTVLADVILPADDFGPAASAVRVPDFIDEWVSAPYPDQQRDSGVIVNGLEWLAAESQSRFGAPFAKLTTAQQHAICDDICYAKTATREFETAANFFSRFRSIASGAYYATMPGWKAIGYVGNVSLVTFDGPPPEALAKLGVEQTVK